MKKINKLTLEFTQKGKNIIKVYNDIDEVTFEADIDDTKSTAIALKIVEDIINSHLNEMFNELAQLGALETPKLT